MHDVVVMHLQQAASASARQVQQGTSGRWWGRAVPLCARPWQQRDHGCWGCLIVVAFFARLECCVDHKLGHDA